MIYATYIFDKNLSDQGDFYWGTKILTVYVINKYWDTLKWQWIAKTGHCYEEIRFRQYSLGNACVLLRFS